MPCSSSTSRTSAPRPSQAELETYRGLDLTCIEVASNRDTGMADLKRALGGRRDAAGRPVGRRQVLLGECPGARSRGADGRVDPRCGGTAHHDHGALVQPAARHSAIIDAPGVRDFAPPASLVRAAERGFAEIHRIGTALPVQGLPAYGGAGLRGAHRRHHRQIAARRYESYRRLCRLYEKLAQRPLRKRWCGRPAHAPACRRRRIPVRRRPERHGRFATP